MHITNIIWPIYYLGDYDKIFTEYNVTYIEYNGSTKIIDNKNLVGDTLGTRRLKINKDDINYFRKTLFIFSELIELTRKKPNRSRMFIDNSGVMFNYIKTKYYKLRCFKIKKVTQLKKDYLVSVYGTEQKFYIPNNYYREYYMYLLAIQYNSIYILYDLVINHTKDTVRKL